MTAPPDITPDILPEVPRDSLVGRLPLRTAGAWVASVDAVSTAAFMADCRRHFRVL